MLACRCRQRLDWRHLVRPGPRSTALLAFREAAAWACHISMHFKQEDFCFEL